MTELDSLRYPVGRFERLTKPLDAAARRIHVKTIEDTPARFRSLVSGLSDAQLELPYRPGGWTIRQVVHHVPDSHLNAYIRMKLAATEDTPTIRTYEEQLWARAFAHPDWGRVTIDEAIAMYAWHSRHHAAHIERALMARVT